MTWEEYTKFATKHRGAYPIRHAEDMSAVQPATGSAAGSSTDSLVLPLASQGSRETVESTPETSPPSLLVAAACDLDDSLSTSQDVTMSAPETNVPSLMIAETFGADEAMPMIQEAHMERGLELEALALEARREYQHALAERGGQ